MSKSDKDELFGITHRSSPPQTKSHHIHRKISNSKSPNLHLAGAISMTQRERNIKQENEADISRSQADKYMTKSWKQWNCDHFSAAPLYEKAGAGYRACGKDELAIAMFVKASECQIENRSYTLAAKDLKEAAVIATKIKNPEKAAELYHSAAEAWRLADELGKAGEYLGKSARILEEIDEDRAAEEYKIAIETLIPAKSRDSLDFMKLIGAKETFDYGIRFLIEAKKVKDALSAIRRYGIFLRSERAFHTLYRLYLTESILLLHMDDYVAADFTFRDIHLQDTGYLHAPECRVAEDLITAFKNFDSELLERTKKDRALLRLDEPTVRLAHSLFVVSFGVQEKEAEAGVKVSDEAAFAAEREFEEENGENEKVDCGEVDLGLDELVFDDGENAGSIEKARAMDADSEGGSVSEDRKVGKHDEIDLM